MSQKPITERRFLKIGDIDIDVADRSAILRHIKHIPAYIASSNKKHASGIYVTQIPYNPITGAASIDYREAEERGYYKLDILNNSVYSHITSNEMLEELLEKPIPWNMLLDRSFFESIIHIGNHYDMSRRLHSPIDSIEKMAIFLGLIRPGKRHLANKPWDIIEKHIWEQSNTGYTFKRSHAIAYSHLVTIDMKLKESAKNTQNTDIPLNNS